VQQHQGHFPIAALCRALRVAKSGYYAWCGRQPSARHRENETITQRIREHFEVSRQTYGSPRILRDLREEGIACGKHRVAKLMKQAGLCALVPRRFQVTTDSKHALPVAKNLLNQDFTASKADERWAADITYLWTGEGWLYLAVVLDLFSRRVVGSVAPAQPGPCRPACTRSWCWAHWSWHWASAALIPGCCTIATPSPAVTEGSQYASTDYQTRLQEAQIAWSMSACKPACAAAATALTMPLSRVSSER